MQYVILILIGYILIKQNPGLLSGLSSTLKSGVSGIIPSGYATPSKPPISVDTAWQMATATETNLNPEVTSSSTYINGAKQQILLYQLYIEPSQCTGQANHLPLSSIISKEALTGASIAGKVSHAAILTGPVGIAVASIATVVTQIIGAIVAHHRAAVQRDNVAFCTYVPAMNNALSVLIGGVQQGQLTAAQCIEGLRQLPDSFLQGVGAAKNNSPYCNALCEQLIQLRAICFYWRSQLGDQSI